MQVLLLLHVEGRDTWQCSADQTALSRPTWSIWLCASRAYPLAAAEYQLAVDRSDNDDDISNCSTSSINTTLIHRGIKMVQGLTCNMESGTDAFAQLTLKAVLMTNGPAAGMATSAITSDSCTADSCRAPVSVSVDVRIRR